MPFSKRICNVCRKNPTVKDGVCTAISWRCSRCFKGACRHVPSYPIKKEAVCGECFAIHLDQQAIQKGAA
jgi:hypothetical protein